MANSDNPLQRATIGVQAHDTGARYSAGSTNGMLELAGSLRELEPTVGRALQTYAVTQQREQDALARKDAITTNGAKLADAVRDGTIKPTQNPWYMQSYSREAAAVSTRTALSQLQLDSATWAEKNDPKAFAARWSSELGKIGEGFTGVDAAQGFAPVANQFTEQTLAANQAQNVSRIEVERVQNASSLLAGDISKANLATGGTPTAAQLGPTIQASRASWLGTGGSVEAWNKMVASAVTSAAYTSKNPDLIDLLKDPSLSGDGKTNVYAIAGIADAAESDRYRISQAVENQASGRVRAMQAQLAEVGQKGMTDLYDKFGQAITLGDVSVQDMNTYLIGKSYKPSEAAAAIAAVGHLTSQVASAQTARLTINSTDPGRSAMVLDLVTQATTGGYTPGVASKVKALVLSGDLRAEEASSIIRGSVSRSEHFDSEARSDARQRDSDIRRNAAEKDHSDVASLKTLRQRALNVGARAARNVTVIQKKGTFAPPAAIKEAQQVAVGASQGWLAAHPDDYNGAALAAHDATEAWGHAKIGKGGSKGAPSGRR